MTNPFADSFGPDKTAKTTAVPVEPVGQKDAQNDDTPKNLGLGDPFAAPAGIGDGSRIKEFVDRLLLVKPTEIIEEMNTAKGKAHNVVRADLAVLDDSEEPGRIVEGVLLFQQALKREAANIYNGPLPYLLGRLNKGLTNGGNDLYTFQEANESEVELARQFLKARTL